VKDNAGALLFSIPPTIGCYFYVKDNDTAKGEWRFIAIANSTIVADNIASVNIVADNINDVNTVADNINDVNTVVDNLSVVTTVANNIDSVNIVADNINDVNTVTANIGSVNTNSENIVVIQSASANAISAQQSAASAAQNAQEVATIADSLFMNYSGVTQLMVMQYDNTSFPDALSASPITNVHPDDVTPAYNALSTTDDDYSFGVVEFNVSAGFLNEQVPVVRADLASNLYMGSYDCGFVVNTREYPPLSVILDQTLDFNELDLHTDFDVMYFDEYDFNV
jgi:hypothetical protein